MNKKIKYLLLTAAISLTTTLSSKLQATESSSIPNPNNVLKSFGRNSESILPNKLNIVIWNLYKGKRDTFEKEFLELTKDADLIIAQEMFLNYNMHKVMLSKEDYFYQTATSFFKGKKKERTGVFTATKTLPLAASYVKTINSEPVAKTPKVTLLTTYQVEGIERPLMVANIHGINFVSNKVFTEEINRVFNELQHHQGPIIFAGDFNTWNSYRLRTLDLLASTIGLKAATFFPDNRKTFNGHKLDQFYHTNDIVVTQARAQTELNGSDHTPMVVEVQIMKSYGQ